MAKKINPDFTVRGAAISQCWGPWKWKKGKKGSNDGGFLVHWQTKSAGFGEFVFCMKNGNLVINNECMSRRFVMDVLKKLVEKAILVDQPPAKK